MKLAIQRINIVTAYIIQYEELATAQLTLPALRKKKKRLLHTHTHTHDILSYHKKYYQTKLVTRHHILSTVRSPLVASTKANYTKQFVAKCNI